MRRTLWPAVSLTGALLLLTGVAYPALLYAVGRITMPWSAGGSLVRDRGGRVIGSALIGQSFASARYFHGRPSAVAYDAAASGASNLGPTNPALADSIARAGERFRAQNGLAPGTPLPSDAVTASGSGLDPDISPDAATLQIARVAAARHTTPAAIAALVTAQTRQPLLGIVGEPRVNVLLLNLALDSALAHR
jgi:potassium-transporting ATPase KdpC subunit